MCYIVISYENDKTKQIKEKCHCPIYFDRKLHYICVCVYVMVENHRHMRPIQRICKIKDTSEKQQISIANGHHFPPSGLSDSLAN